MKEHQRLAAHDTFTEDGLYDLIEARPRVTSQGYAISGLAYPDDNPLVWIKSGVNLCSGTDAEARTQQGLYEALDRAPNRQCVRVPKIYRTFFAPEATIIVMEHVPGRTLRDLDQDLNISQIEIDNYFSKVEQALKLCLSLPVPKDARPGPYEGGIIRHPLFKYYEVPIEYESVDHLEKHLNKVATLKDPDSPKVSLERELHLVLADLNPRNFMFAEDEVYLIDFQQANFLPLSFMTYAMIQGRTVSRVNLDLPQQNLTAMRWICQWFVMSVPQIGLPL